MAKIHHDASEEQFGPDDSVVAAAVAGDKVALGRIYVTTQPI